MPTCVTAPHTRSDNSGSLAPARRWRRSCAIRRADVRQAAIESIAEPARRLARVGDRARTQRPERRRAEAGTRSRSNELKAPIPEATLLILLRDPDADVRSKAADFAGERSVVGAIPSLRRMIDDDEPRRA